MTLINPRLTDYYNLPVMQEELDFPIPFLNEDIPLYVDPFLLWKSPSQQDQSLHIGMISSINSIGQLYKEGDERRAIDLLVSISECTEVGLGMAADRVGLKIGESKADEILSLFSSIPQIERDGIKHIEVFQLLVNQISKDRISDFTCNLLKSFLIDYTIDQCQKLNIPTRSTKLSGIFDIKRLDLVSETVDIPLNPISEQPILLVPKRWLRYIPWINYESYFENTFTTDEAIEKGLTERIAVLNYNRNNYDVVDAYIRNKERQQADCKTDPLFKAIPVLSAKRKWVEIQKLPTGKDNNADKKYEDLICQLMTSIVYPYLDFSDEQSRTDEGTLIRDLIFYNSRSMDFLTDLYNDFGSKQIIMELKNVKEIKGIHINQLNRYLNDPFGGFGIIITRNPLPRAMLKNTISLWAGQRKCIISLTDEDIGLMVNLFDNKQRLPIEVIKRAYIRFMRLCPS